MCDFSGKLIAWLDCELPEAEAVNVEWHVGQCAECRSAAAVYREVSDAFLVCHEAAMSAPPRRKPPLRTLGLLAAAAAAILLAIFLNNPRSEEIPLHLPPAPPAPAMAFKKTPPPMLAVHSRHRAVPPPTQQEWVPIEPTVEVVLPADAFFPPGAVPVGFSYIADVRP